MRKQFLELRLVRNKWKKEFLGESDRTVEDFRKEIHKKLKISEETSNTHEIIPLSSKSISQPEPVEETVSDSTDSPKISQIRDDFISERLVSGFSPKSISELESTINNLIEICRLVPVFNDTK